MSRRQLATALAALGTTAAIAACGSPSGQDVPALSNIAAAVPTEDPAADPALDDPAAGPALDDPAADPGLEQATGDGDGSGGDENASTSTSGADRDGSVAGDSAPRTSTPGAVQGRIATQLVAKEVPQLGGVVTDQEGAIVYRFEKDSPKQPTSNCNGACAKTWPPVLAEATPDLEGVSAGKVGTVQRADGTTQITLGGWPLYYYSKDSKPGDAKGQGVGGTWFVVAKDGKKNTKGVNRAAPAAAAGSAVAGRVVTELVVVHHPQLGSVVTDQKGAIVYRFEKDSPKQPTSNCNGACAKTWPPALANTQIRVLGISPDQVGTIKRTDGRSQLTLAGRPLYYYSKDAKPGDAKGQGVGGAWFVASTDGRKNTNGVSGNVVPSAGRATQPAAAGYDSY